MSSMSFSKIQEPKASGSRQGGPLATAGSSECHTWHLGPDPEIQCLVILVLLGQKS